MNTDRRSKNREILHVPVTEKGSDGITSGMIINLSEGGLCYYKFLSDIKNDDDQVALSFITSGQARPLKVESSVVYRRTLDTYTVIGVAFKDPTFKVQDLVHKHIKNITNQVPNNPQPLTAMLKMVDCKSL